MYFLMLCLVLAVTAAAAVEVYRRDFHFPPELRAMLALV